MEKNIVTIFAVMTLLLSGCLKKANSEADDSVHESELHHNVNEEAATEDKIVITLKKQPFSCVVKAGGRIISDARDIKVITAKSSGIVKFKDQSLYPGVKIEPEQQLFTISGDHLAGDNTELYLRQIKSDLEEATANYERAKMMISDKIITEEHFLAMQNKYEKLINEYNNLKGSAGEAGISISSSDHGYIKEVLITEGQKVVPGQPLALLITEHNTILKADISPEYLDILPSIEKANFKVGYSSHLFKTDEMNGRKISYGKSTGENSFYIPVYFRMNHNTELVEGTFAEVYLIGAEIKDALVVPNTALLEEYGKLYVYVEDDDGDFHKRYITTDINNGEYTRVITGLDENERIVASGAYRIKLSQISADAPVHNHNH